MSEHGYDSDRLAAVIDQTLLSPKTGFAAGFEWIDSNADRGFASLCVPPFLVPVAGQRLAGTRTVVCSVCAFPLGYAATETKVDEASRLVTLGAREVDVVMHIGAFLEGEFVAVRDDLIAVVRAVEETSEGGALVKVIIETGYLDENGVASASEIVAESGAAFVKTSTGFGPRGASVQDVEIMRRAVGPELGIKAAGGIRDLEIAMGMLEAGATRLGTSSGVELLGQLDAS